MMLWSMLAWFISFETDVEQYLLVIQQPVDLSFQLERSVQLGPCQLVFQRRITEFVVIVLEKKHLATEQRPRQQNQ